MIKLLKAGFFRLRKEVIFWLFIISSIIVSIYFFLTQWNSESDNIVVVLDKIINEYSIFIGFFIAIFVSVFVGKEQMYGIIRNKIIVRT